MIQHFYLLEALQQPSGMVMSLQRHARIVFHQSEMMFLSNNIIHIDRCEK